jgi:ribosome-associated translation inhibitor RaiA
MSPINIQVTTRGDVSDRARQQTREKFGSLGRLVKAPILGVRVVLIQEANPPIARPALAEAEVDLQGRFVRARATAPSMDVAVDDVAERLQRHLRRDVERLITREREPAQATPGEWSHRFWSPPRPPTFARPAEEREIVRRKSFAFGARSIDEAADALEDIDHDFLPDADEVVCLLEPEVMRAVGLWYEHFEATADAEIAKLLADDADDPPLRPMVRSSEVRIPAGHGPELIGDLVVPASPGGLVVFAHSSGSSRHCPRNRLVARALNERWLATLLLDLLTVDEELDRANVFEIWFERHLPTAGVRAA